MPKVLVSDPIAEAGIAHLREVAEVDVKLRTSSASPMGRYTVDAPTVQTVSRVEVVSVEPTGDAALTSEVEQVKVLDDTSDPSIRKAVETEATKLKAMRSSGAMDSSSSRRTGRPRYGEFAKNPWSMASRIRCSAIQAMASIARLSQKVRRGEASGDPGDPTAGAIRTPVERWSRDG